MQTSKQPTLIRTRELQQRIALLGSVETTDSAFVSCYLDLSQGESACRGFLDRQVQAHRRTLQGEQRADFDAAVEMIAAQLAEPRHPQAKGMAIFARSPWGGRFLTTVQSAVAMDNQLTVYPAPDVYPLLELHDTYERYMLVVIKPAYVKVIEVNLGAASVRAWASNKNPARRQVRDCETLAVDLESIDIESQLHLVTRLLQSHGRMHLFLAGEHELAWRLEALLPTALAGRVIDVLPLTPAEDEDVAVASSIRHFVEFEEDESRKIAARVLKGARPGGLGVTGSLACLRALRERRADTLVIASGYRPEAAWVCGHCGAGEIERDAPARCAECDHGQVQALDLRVEMVRLAAQQGVPVEVVEGSELRKRGGVGCLLHNLAADRSMPLQDTGYRRRLVA